MEEESFELLSSMSPKVKHCQKHFRKGTSILALRKSLQRSTVYDKSIHTVNNDKLIIAESSSATTTETGSSKSSNSFKINTVPIIIVRDSESDSESIELISLVSSPSNSLNTQSKVKEEHCSIKSTECDVRSEKCVLPQEKFENIKQWIDIVNQSKVQDNTTTYSVYSELSTIYGENKNFVSERTGRAVNSTAIGSASVHFEELFKHKTDHISNRPKKYFPEVKDEQSCIDDSFYKKQVEDVNGKDDIINESYVNQSTNSSKNSQRHIHGSHNIEKDDTLNSDKNKNNDDTNDSDSSFSILDYSLNTKLNKNKSQTNSARECNDTSNKSPEENKYEKKNEDNNIDEKDESTCDELASMLDDLYGDKWRERIHHVLPKSEPRKRIPARDNINVVQSERKPKYSITHKNPYMENEKLKSSSLLKTMQKSRLNNYMESPMLKRLNEFCDSDTDSKDSESQIVPRLRLNFQESDCEEEFGDIENKSKYFKNRGRSNNEAEAKKDTGSDKENFDNYLFLGQSLEERVKKKINGVKTSLSDKIKKNINTLDKKKPLTSRQNTEPSANDKRVKSARQKGADTERVYNDSNSSDDEWDREINKMVHENKQINGKYSFLASLSVNVPINQCDMSARIYRNNFKLYKDQLLTKLFKLFNEKIFDNALPNNTLLEWNDRMRGTAGFCYCKKITRRTGTVERTARIVLATKVIDAAYRLRDTLVHEMCHAATWIVNCVSDGHGPYWKSWASKAMKTFPELPPIKRCHDYVINTKYTYRCVGCGYSIGRHTKSLDIERKRCGHCYGKFEVLLNKVSKKGETKSVPATPKKEVTGFALFVKENYGTYKQGNLKHGDVMKLLGQKFQELKLKTT